MKKLFNTLCLLLTITVVILLPCCLVGCSSQQQVVSVINIEKTQTSDSIDTYTIFYSDGSTSQFEIKNGKDGESLEIEDIYHQYIEKYGDISYSDFLKEFLSLSIDNRTVINQCLLSSMKVYTEFTISRGSGYGPYSPTTKSVEVQCGSAVIYKMYEDVTYIVTNYHVVYNSNANSDNGGKIARSIHGYLYGSEKTPVNSGTTENGYTVYDYGQYALNLTYVGGSIDYDIAVLKIETNKLLAINENAQAVKLADGYYVGETAIAIGNPENEGISATQGIVSVDNEYISLQIDTTTRSYRSIRIDTAIYGGSSGGGLFNVYGELIGITNAGNSTDQNINYAIPVEIVRNVTKNILDSYDGENFSTVKKISLGITVTSANSKYSYNENNGYGQITETVVVNSVTADSIAEKIGLQKDDIIKSIQINNSVFQVNRYFEIGDILLSVCENNVLVIVFERDSQTSETNSYNVTSTDLVEL